MEKIKTDKNIAHCPDVFTHMNRKDSTFPGSGREHFFTSFEYLNLETYLRLWALELIAIFLFTPFCNPNIYSYGS